VLKVQQEGPLRKKRPFGFYPLFFSTMIARGNGDAMDA
jgi:hypothetical protein